jgi:uncharacterized protein YbjT (DUF2867 family)
MGKTYCVVGATRGTGLQIAKQLLQRGSKVRVIARDPEKARELLGARAEIFSGDVTVPDSLGGALNADCDAIFYAVDITGGIGGHSFFGSTSKIRDVTFQGLVNVVEAARAGGFKGRIVLLSGMGCDKPSLPGRILNLVKGNLQKNMVDRERYLKESGFDYAVCRGAVLTNAPGGEGHIRITAPIHSLSPSRKLARADFARVLIAASELAAASRKVYDVLGEHGFFNEDRDIAAQLEAVPRHGGTGLT